MIISDRHRFVFVHVPKCAGTAVRRAHFPAEYAKVRDYASFALVRDPFAPFPSASPSA